MNKSISAFQRHDVLQDEVIWKSKRYLPRPRLCRSDGEIMRYRRYCAQFYPDPSDSASPLHVEIGGATGAASPKLSQMEG